MKLLREARHFVSRSKGAAELPAAFTISPRGQRDRTYPCAC